MQKNIYKLEKELKVINKYYCEDIHYLNICILIINFINIHIALLLSICEFSKLGYKVHRCNTNGPNSIFSNYQFYFRAII